MVHLERKGWLWGWWRLFTNLNILFFADKKTQGKWQEHRENTGNLVLIGAWQPCGALHLYQKKNCCDLCFVPRWM